MLYRGVGIGSVKKRQQSKQSKKHTEEPVEKLVDKQVVNSDEESYKEESEESEELEEQVNKKIVWNNYSKKDLYFKWLKARNDATDLRKDKMKLEEVRKNQAKEIRDYVKQLKGADSLTLKNDGFRKRLESETAKAQREKFENKALLDSKQIMLEKIKSKYEVMTTKAEIETTATLGKLELKFDEVKLQLDAKEREVKTLADENKKLKKKVDKLEDLAFSKSKTDLQLLSMNEKNMIRYVTLFV